MDLCVVSHLPPQHGRLADYGRHLCDWFGQRHDLTVVTQQGPVPDPIDGAELLPILTDDPARLLNVARTISRLSPDAVLYNTNMGLFGNRVAPNTVSCLLPRLIDAPVLTLLHGTTRAFDLDTIDRVPDWMPHTSIRWAEDQLISGSDTVTLTLEPFRDALRQDGHDNVHHVPHGTPCIPPSDDPQDILAAGYWGQDKALGTVLRKAPDLSDRLTVIGGRHPEYPDHLEELRSDHPAVTFTGRVDESRFRNAFAEARHALLTNRSPKGTSGILNYAAAGGTAPIILEDSGMEAVAAAEGYDTITVPEQDLTDLGRILKEAPADEIARQNRATAQEKTFDTAFTALQKLLKDTA